MQIKLNTTNQLKNARTRTHTQKAGKLDTSKMSGDRATLSGEARAQKASGPSASLLQGLQNNFGDVGASAVAATSKDTKGVRPTGYKMRYDGEHLHLYDSKGKLLKKWRATSGKPGMKATQKDQATKDQGPLPEGKYTLDPSKYKKHGWRRRARIHQDWGEFGGRLVPDKNNKVKSRDKFYIHGGVVPGSNGCLDLGLNDGALHKMIKNHKGRIPLEVRYKKKYQKKPVTKKMGALEHLSRRELQLKLQAGRFIKGLF